METWCLGAQWKNFSVAAEFVWKRGKNVWVSSEHWNGVLVIKVPVEDDEGKKFQLKLSKAIIAALQSDFNVTLAQVVPVSSIRDRDSFSVRL